MDNWTGKPVYLKIKTKIQVQLGSLHLITSEYSMMPPNEGSGCNFQKCFRCQH